MTGNPSILDQALAIARRNPIGVMLAIAGAGWLIHRGRASRRAAARAALLEEESVPILNIGHARIYDPDTSPRYPTHDQLESRREMSARA